MTDADTLWAAIDPEDHRTLDAALDHLRISLSAELCPFCEQALDLEAEGGLSYLICLNCATGFPAYTPPQSTEGLNPSDRRDVAMALVRMRERLD